MAFSAISMHNTIAHIKQACVKAIEELYAVNISTDDVQLSPTNENFEGDFTIVVFPFTKLLRKGPEEIGKSIGEVISNALPEIENWNVVKGFLNLKLDSKVWVNFLSQIDANYWTLPNKNETVFIEFGGPNTNKPLHLGHARNLFVGWSMSQILEKAGYKVHRVNIYNDRGIAICKSMVAWDLFANGETPADAYMKGDHFVGKYYVRYGQIENEQAVPFIAQGMDKRAAAKQTAIFQQAQDYLQRWENGDKDILALWNKMNAWVYEGFNKTYESIGVKFERDYMESKTYLLGKKIVEKGVKDGIFFAKNDGSTWVDLTEEGLDEKILLRSDGTSVYITQDIGTAELRNEHFGMDKGVYVVGNEQDYHFKVLFEVLKKMGRKYANGLYHLSYGMVDLPSGRMKTREGTIVDADNLIAEMITTAKNMTDELGKLDDFDDAEKESLYKAIGLGALKYFILKVNAKKRILFNPEESIELHGNTGPFIQYTYARIQSISRKAKGINHVSTDRYILNPEEREMANILFQYRNVLEDAAKHYDPSLIANYVFGLAKTYNKFYAKHAILKEQNAAAQSFRLQLSIKVSRAIKVCLDLLGMEAPEKM